MIVFLGTAANSVAFQAFLLDEVTRWNADRAVGAVQDPDNTLYTFDKFLQHQLNSLTMSIRNEEFSPHFTPPGKYTGELIGVQYLRSQSDSFVDKDLEKEIDDAFEDYQSEVDETTEETQEIHNLTLARDLKIMFLFLRMTIARPWILQGCLAGIRCAGSPTRFSISIHL